MNSGTCRWSDSLTRSPSIPAASQLGNVAKALVARSPSHCQTMSS